MLYQFTFGYKVQTIISAKKKKSTVSTFQNYKVCILLHSFCRIFTLGENVNAVKYCEILKNLKRAVQKEGHIDKGSLLTV